MFTLMEKPIQLPGSKKQIIVIKNKGCSHKSNLMKKQIRIPMMIKSLTNASLSKKLGLIE